MTRAVVVKPGSRALPVILSFIGMLWVIYLTDVLLTRQLAPQPGHPWAAVVFASWAGIQSLTLQGLCGIPLAPFIHASPEHIAANSVGLLLLGWPCWRYSPRLTLVAVGYSILYGGLLAWSLGNIGVPASAQPAVHIGASGIIFGLIGFLIGNGLFRGGCIALLLALVTAIAFYQVLPQALPPSSLAHAPKVSWQMHLGGLIGGLSAAWHQRQAKP